MVVMVFGNIIRLVGFLSDVCREGGNKEFPLNLGVTDVPWDPSPDEPVEGLQTF